MTLWRARSGFHMDEKCSNTSLIFVLHDDNDNSDDNQPAEGRPGPSDDNVDDCDDGNGHPLKNSPKEVRKEFLVGGMTVRCDAMESLKWVSPAAKLLELPPRMFSI